MQNEPLTPIRPQIADDGRIGIIAPASPFDRDLFETGLAIISGLGWTPVVPDTIWNKNGYLAGDDAHRVAQLHRMFADSSIDAVFCARGGYGALRLLPLIDVDLIARNPKPFVGFSDITALLNLFCDQCHFTTFHGPVVTSLARGSSESIESLHQVLSGKPDYRIPFSTEKVLQHGNVTAPIKGGNLTILSHLAGTPFCPDLNDTLLLIEDCNEETYRIDRKMTHLKLSGCLDRIAGILLGDFTGCGPIEEIQQIISDQLGKCSIPIICDIEAGHGPVNRTIPLGIPVTLDSRAGLIKTDSLTI
jgi:muramoyltetrapeptide carboxypeptidase